MKIHLDGTLDTKKYVTNIRQSHKCSDFEDRIKNLINKFTKRDFEYNSGRYFYTEHPKSKPPCVWPQGSEASLLKYLWWFTFGLPQAFCIFIVTLLIRSICYYFRSGVEKEVH